MSVRRQYARAKMWGLEMEMDIQIQRNTPRTNAPRDASSSPNESRTQADAAYPLDAASHAVVYTDVDGSCQTS